MAETLFALSLWLAEFLLPLQGQQQRKEIISMMEDGCD